MILRSKSDNIMNEIKRHRLIIVGAGASGMMAGCIAGLYCDDVLILDANNAAGKKLLATGNGKCNFTNIFVRDDKYNRTGSDTVSDIYERFDFENVLQFFERLGVPVRIRDGYCYPYSQEASSVRDALLFRLRELNVRIKLSNRIKKIEKDTDGDFFRVITDEGYAYEAEKVILSCGGMAGSAFGCDGSVYEILKHLGCGKINKPLPALVGLCSSNSCLGGLAGVRVMVKAALLSEDETVRCDSGEVIFSSNGISGIPVMNLSRYAAKILDNGRRCSLKLDFFEDISASDLERMIKDMLHARSIPVEEALVGLINRKLLKVVLKKSGNDELNADSDELNIKELAGELKEFELDICDTNGFENAQVTTGGLPLDLIDRSTMETRFCKGLFVTGETLDVDACCGGYNLQWAWTTGAIAGACATYGTFDSDRLFKE